MSILRLLEGIGAVNRQSVELLAERTRDREVPVWRDTKSGVIFIDDFYVGDREYELAEYRCCDSLDDFEDKADTKRRLQDFASYAMGKAILDFGCGTGSFLRGVKPIAKEAYGVELDEASRARLLSDGIACWSDVRECPDIDVAFMFHVVEHLPDPLTTLVDLRRSLEGQSGLIVVEVPHARDFLLADARCEAFTKFTLWSQHLVLHTRDSLTKLLARAGFQNIETLTVQRYGMANHLQWLLEGRPGGHKGPLARLIPPNLEAYYRSALLSRDATDTIVAIAQAVPRISL